MLRHFVLLSLSALFFSCQSAQPAEETASHPDFTVLSGETDAIEYENLRLYPIRAEDRSAVASNLAAGWKNLREAIEEPRFRITEKKPYGRFEDREAVNTLTVQNKSTDTVFIMAGDVVQGGRQDRVIAADRVIPPRTITDIPVFCVEKGRWHFEEDESRTDEAAGQPGAPVYAFRGYYQVASSDLRRSISAGDQEAVWAQVGEMHARHEVEAPTHAYAGLEDSPAFTQLRDRYLQSLLSALNDRDDLIGILAVSGDRVLGADLFGHPALFKKQSEALLHGYIADAVSAGAPVTIAGAGLDRFVAEMRLRYRNGQGRFDYHDFMVHFSQL